MSGLFEYLRLCRAVVGRDFTNLVLSRDELDELIAAENNIPVGDVADLARAVGAVISSGRRDSGYVADLEAAWTTFRDKNPQIIPAVYRAGAR